MNIAYLKTGPILFSAMFISLKRHFSCSFLTEIIKRNGISTFFYVRFTRLKYIQLHLQFSFYFPNKYHIRIAKTCKWIHCVYNNHYKIIINVV